VKLYEYAFVPAVIASAAMLLMLIATVAWAWFSYSAMPQVFSENWGLLLSSTTTSFVVIIGIMMIATAMALFGLARGRSAQAGGS